MYHDRFYMFDMVSGKEGPDLWTFGICCSQALQGCLNPQRPRPWLQKGSLKSCSGAIWCPWPVVSCSKKQEALLPGWIEGTFQPWDVEELEFHWTFLWRFFQLSLKFLCIVFLGNEVCPVSKSNNYFWGLAHISGIWMGVMSHFTVF